jgi:hypothetical protein
VVGQDGLGLAFAGVGLANLFVELNGKCCFRVGRFCKQIFRFSCFIPVDIDLSDTKGEKKEESQVESQEHMI